MPNGKDYPKLTRTQFENAVRAYVDQLEEAALDETGVLKSRIKEFILEKWPWSESPSETFDAIYFEIMDAADMQGIGPWLPFWEEVVGGRVKIGS